MNNVASASVGDSFLHDRVGTLTREEFLKAFEELEGKFKNNKQKASSTEKAFFAGLTRLREVAQRDALDKSPLDPQHPLREILQERVRKIQNHFTHWDQEVSKRNTNATFKERTADSLLVFVYGKVKAGKSSLGNYIAWGKAEPTEQDKATCGKEPKYFVEMSSNLTENVSAESIGKARQFKVGESETTSAIQGFNLPGLTWVDSPGLHSKNRENGGLAQKYVDAADLILYVTNSSAPCKRSDMVELQELGKREHTLSIIITGSDMYDEDEDSNGELTSVLQMKPETDREAQLNYVRQSLDQQGEMANSEESERIDRTLRRAQVHSVSVAYAAEHPDSIGVAHSGVGRMLHDVAVLAKAEGVRAKLTQPLNNLCSFLRHIQDNDLKKINQYLDEVILEVKRTQSIAESDARQRLQRIEFEIGPTVDELVSKNSNDSKAFKFSLNEAYKKWVEEGHQEIAQAFAASLSGGLAVSMDEDAIGQLPEFEPVTRKFERRTSINSKRGAALGGLLGAASLLVPGGVLVAAAAGLAAAAVGSFAGSKVGGIFDDTESVDVVIGDNSQEVAMLARKAVREKFTERTSLLLTGMNVLCFSDLLQWTSELQVQTRRMDVNTASLLAELNERIAEV